MALLLSPRWESGKASLCSRSALFLVRGVDRYDGVSALAAHGSVEDVVETLSAGDMFSEKGLVLLCVVFGV